MPLIQTAEITPTWPSGANSILQTYCGLDCCITLEVREELGRQFNQPPAIYEF